MCAKRSKRSATCITRYCKNDANQGRYCKTCISRRYRSRNPMRAAYNALKQNAVRRGIPFTITYEYFARWCHRSDYMAGKGRTKESYTIDREKNHLGYVPGNLRVLTNSENARKVNRVLMYDWQSRTAMVVSRTG
jgi:hypothetical protein